MSYTTGSKTIVFAVALSAVFGLSNPASANVIQSFDGGGTGFVGTLSKDAFASGSRVGPTVVGGGPSGNFLRLIQYPTTFGRYRTGLGFDQTVSGAVERVQLSFDFRITCAGARTGFSGGGCADGFSVSFLDAATHGPSGALITDENGIAQTFVTAPSPEILTKDGLSVGFRYFTTGSPANSTIVSLNNGFVAGSGSGVSTSELDFATGLHNAPGAFHRAEIDLFLGAIPTLTMSIFDGTDSSLSVLYNSFALPSLGDLGANALRLNFGARVGDASSTIDLDNINAQFTLAQSGNEGVPAPGALALLGVGLFGLVMRRRTA